MPRKKDRSPLESTFGVVTLAPLFLSTKMVSATLEGVTVDKPDVKLTYPDGYTSSCPYDVFKRDYQPHTSLSFSGALFCVARGGVVLSESLRIELWAVARASRIGFLHNVKNVNGTNHLSLVDVESFPIAWALAKDWHLIGTTDGKVFDPHAAPRF